MGNRGGAFHLPDQTLGPRRWATTQWIACVLEFKGRHRQVMQPNRYTELFFLDEATALAAGHRPCFECRRADAERFAELWARAQGLAQGRPLGVRAASGLRPWTRRCTPSVWTARRQAHLPGARRAISRAAPSSATGRTAAARVLPYRRQPSPGLAPVRLHISRQPGHNRRDRGGAHPTLHRCRTFGRISSDAASLGRSLARLNAALRISTRDTIHT